MHEQVQAYINTLDGESKTRVKLVRDYVLSTFSTVEEGVSYGVIMFHIGKKRFHLGGFAKHIGLYPGVKFIEKYKVKYPHLKTSKGTIQIQNKQDIPFDLVDLMVFEILGVTK